MRLDRTVKIIRFTHRLKWLAKDGDGLHGEQGEKDYHREHN